MGGVTCVFLKVCCVAALLLAIFPSFAAVPQNSAPALKMTPHQLFQNLYSKATSQPKYQYDQSSRLKKTITRFKSMTNVSLSHGLKLKLSKIKSRPISQNLTEMVKIAPGLQTHEGRISESSDGYGVKFSFKF